MSRQLRCVGRCDEWHVDCRNPCLDNELQGLITRLCSTLKDRLKSERGSICQSFGPGQSSKRKSSPLVRILSPFPCGLCEDLRAIRRCDRCAQEGGQKRRPFAPRKRSVFGNPRIRSDCCDSNIQPDGEHVESVDGTAATTSYLGKPSCRPGQL